MRTIRGFLTLTTALLASACGEGKGNAASAGAANPVAAGDAKISVVIRGGPALDENAKNFRVREVEPDFYWVVSDDYEIRIDPWFPDGDAQSMADELRARNTSVRYFDEEAGAKILCGKDWEEDIVGDLQRTMLSPSRVEATFRIELDKCTLNDEVIPGKAVTLSGTLSLPRTDQ